MNESLRVFFVDNFDSFTFNLVDEFAKRGASIEVWRNTITVDALLERIAAWNGPRLVVLSPGPGTPDEAGCCIDLLRASMGHFPIFGVCLGHQAIIKAFGGVVSNAGEIVHGKVSAIIHAGTGIFSGLPSPLTVGRYHSLVGTQIPIDVQAIATTKAHDGHDLVMAIEHMNAPIWGVQFHPESILTTQGGILIDNVVQWAIKQPLKGFTHATDD